MILYCKFDQYSEQNLRYLIFDIKACNLLRFYGSEIPNFRGCLLWIRCFEFLFLLELCEYCLLFMLRYLSLPFIKKFTQYFYLWQIYLYQNWNILIEKTLNYTSFFLFEMLHHSYYGHLIMILMWYLLYKNGDFC